MYRLILPIICLLLSSCGSSKSKLVAQKGFLLNKSSVVCINNHFMAAELESVLINLGIQVVPYEYAMSKAIRTEKSTQDIQGYEKRTESYQEITVPAAIYIDIQGYDSMTFRFIDMKSQRLLAVYTYKVDPYYESTFTKSPLKRFVHDIKPYIVQ